MSNADSNSETPFHRNVGEGASTHFGQSSHGQSLSSSEAHDEFQAPTQLFEEHAELEAKLDAASNAVQSLEYADAGIAAVLRIITSTKSLIRKFIGKLDQAVVDELIVSIGDAMREIDDYVDNSASDDVNLIKSTSHPVFRNTKWLEDMELPYFVLSSENLGLLGPDPSQSDHSNVFTILGQFDLAEATLKREQIRFKSAMTSFRNRKSYLRRKLDSVSKRLRTYQAATAYRELMRDWTSKLEMTTLDLSVSTGAETISGRQLSETLPASDYGMPGHTNYEGDKAQLQSDDRCLHSGAAFGLAQPSFKEKELPENSLEKVEQFTARPTGSETSSGEELEPLGVDHSSSEEIVDQAEAEANVDEVAAELEVVAYKSLESESATKDPAAGEEETAAQSQAQPPSAGSFQRLLARWRESTETGLATTTDYPEKGALRASEHASDDAAAVRGDDEDSAANDNGGQSLDADAVGEDLTKGRTEEQVVESLESNCIDFLRLVAPDRIQEIWNKKEMGDTSAFSEALEKLIDDSDIDIFERFRGKKEFHETSYYFIRNLLALLELSKTESGRTDPVRAKVWLESRFAKIFEDVNSADNPKEVDVATE